MTSTSRKRGFLMLQERDYQLLAALDDYAYLTTTQIKEKFFTQGSFVYRRLKKTYTSIAENAPEDW